MKKLSLCIKICLCWSCASYVQFYALFCYIFSAHCAFSPCGLPVQCQWCWPRGRRLATLFCLKNYMFVFVWMNISFMKWSNLSWRFGSDKRTLCTCNFIIHYCLVLFHFGARSVFAGCALQRRFTVLSCMREWRLQEIAGGAPKEPGVFYVFLK